MIKYLLIALIALGGVSSRAAEPTKALPRSSPEEQGISASAIDDFITAADQSIDSFHGFVLLRHGHVVAEAYWSPYDAATPHQLYSLSKSFTSTAVGLAIAEGKLSLNDEILKFFPDDAPAKPSNNLKSMRVRDLMRMSTGHQTEPSVRNEKNWARAFLAHDVPHKPGTHFLYNTAGTYMLSAIVQKVTGQTALDYLRPRLFEPLGIENPTWGTSPQGVSLGGYGLNVRAEDIARFGQLYLQKGKWEGTQLVPEAWVKEATVLQTSNGSNPKSDWDQGYGYQFWRCRHGAFRGDGAFGQYCVVMPEQDAVIAITSGVKNMQAVLDLVWDKLLPAMKPAPLPVADNKAHARLKQHLATLMIHTPESKGSEGMAASVLGKNYVFAANDRKLESIALEREGKAGDMTVVARFDGVEHRVACGRGTWRKGRAAFGMLPDQPAAACGAWTSDDTYTAKVCFHETPFIVTFRLKFAGDKLHFDSESNVGFGSTKQPSLEGHAE